AGRVTTAVTLLYRSCKAFATFFRLAVDAPGFGSGGAFWLAPGAGGMPGPRAPLARSPVLTLATSWAITNSGVLGCRVCSNSSVPATVTAIMVTVAKAPRRLFRNPVMACALLYVNVL